MTNQPWHAPDGYSWVYTPALGVWIGRKANKPSTRSPQWSSRAPSANEMLGNLDLLTPGQMQDRYPNHPKDSSWKM